MFCDSGASIDAVDAVSKIGFETAIHFAHRVSIRSYVRKGDRRIDFEIETEKVLQCMLRWLLVPFSGW